LPPFSGPYVYGLHDQQYHPDAIGRSEEYSPWTSGPQPLPVTTADATLGWAKFGAGIGALALAGRIPVGGGKRVFDWYISAARALEEYSPGRVFRTFQISSMMSPLGQASQQFRYVSPEMLVQWRDVAKYPGGQAAIEHLSHVLGQKTLPQSVIQQGFRYERGQLLLGRTGQEVLLNRAQIFRTTPGAGATFPEAYIRSAAGRAVPGSEKIFSTALPFETATGKIQRETFLIGGGQSRIGSAGRFLGGYGTYMAERLNRLAKAPFELPPFANIMNLPGLRRLKLHVAPSSGLKTLAKITGKLGIIAPAMYLAYQELDHYTRKSELLDNTIFAEGITAGISTAAVRANLLASKAADVFGLHRYRERQEEIAPKSTNISTLAAFPIMGALGELGVSYLGRVSRQVRLQRMGLGIADASMLAAARGPLFQQKIAGKELPEELARAIKNAPRTAVQFIEADAARVSSSWQGAAARRIARIQERGGMTGFFSKFIGKNITPTKVRALLGAAAGTALVAPFIPGALIPGTRPEELEDIYSGEQRIAVKKGRWWEFGRSPYEGTHIEYFRPHWYPRMLARSREVGIYGEDAPSPLKQWYLENFTYELERKHYYDRPYPITGTAFEDTPFLGPILSATVGRLIKPPKLMHTEEWMRAGPGTGASTSARSLISENEYLRQYPRFGYTPVPESLGGELGPGAPITPYGGKGILGEQIYRFTEMAGLPGFTMTAIKDAITNEGDVYADEMQLESARRMYGAERAYWDLSIGGGIGTTELFRRLYPHRRRQIELYNPIRNTMPEWLPGPSGRSMDFLHGDPYSKIPEGEMRLPGPGYAALHPELKDVAPQDYPLIHRFMILADVAPYTEQFKDARIAVQTQIARGNADAREQTLFKRTMDEIRARKRRKDFHQYKYRERDMTPIERILTEHKPQEQPGLLEKTLGSYWETLAHTAETPLEYLTPMSPAAKLVHMRTAIEDYKKTQVYGTQSAFWGHPIRDFFSPFLTSVAHAVGWEGIPGHVQEMRDLEEYFDILKYVKYTALERQAKREGEMDMVGEYEQMRRQTMFGINPYTRDYTSIYRSMPRRGRDYVDEFTKADMTERIQIAKLIPENERTFYEARWKMADAAMIKQAMDKNLLSEDQKRRAEETLRQHYREREMEDMPRNEALWSEYLATRIQGESYPDWYRRTKLLAVRLKGRPLPGPDWVGWHPAVDLEDIKMKIVDQEGRNAYQYDLWPERRRLVARRPVIAEASRALEGKMSTDDVRSRMIGLLTGLGIRGANVSVTEGGPGESAINMHMSENRLAEAVGIVHKGELF
jgi:hypothetical protein